MQNLILGIKGFIAVFLGNLWISIPVTIVAGVIIYFIIKYKKEKVEMTAFLIKEMIKVELSGITDGTEKFDKVFTKFENFPIYQNSILKYIKREPARQFIQFVFDKNKDIIKNKSEK